MSSFLIGIDIGSSASKCVIVDENLRLISQHAQPYPTHFPKPGQAEQDPEDWYRSACQAIQQLAWNQAASSRRSVAQALLSRDRPIASRL